MKTYINSIFLSLVMFLTSACGDEFLEFVPEDQSTVASWYKNSNEIRQATASLYHDPWFGYQDQFGWLAGDLLAGDMHHNWDQEGQFFYLSFNESNPYIDGGFQGLYNVISYANLIIDDMPTIASGHGVDQAVIDAALGEARFFRGAAYFLLVEYWETVPIIEQPAAKVAAGDLFQPKNKTEDIYEFARRDFAFAAENLPTSDVAGRVTQWSAKGMLAKLHVTLGQRFAGGNPNVGSAEDFQIAADYAADVINNSGLSLASNYEDLFKIDNEDDPEILWGIQFINQGYGTGNSRQARYARHSRITGDAQAWGGGKGMTVSYVQNLINNANGMEDERRRAIYMQNGDEYSYIGGGYLYEIVSRDEDDVQMEGATPTLNNLKKYVVGGVADHGYIISNQDSPLDMYMLRLADVYLLHAEALLGTQASLAGGPGYNSYLAVRDRAGLGDPGVPLTYERLFNERRVEFGLEGLAWLDVRRRFYRDANDALNYLNNQGRTDRYYRIDPNDDLENDPAGYELVPAGGGVGTNPDNVNNDPVITFTASDMVMPIPAQQQTVNPLLKPGADVVDYFED
ncbi:MAG: RagB/SusD family nutrient uptake outer membrane protein [Marinoscillum sp.]